MHNTAATPQAPTDLLTETELAARLKTSVASVRWMRRTGRLSFIKIAGNRKVRFIWHQILSDLRASEVRADSRVDERASQLADIASHNDQDAAECAAADLAREFPHPLP
jgi:hypothetical protein